MDLAFNDVGFDTQVLWLGIVVSHSVGFVTLVTTGINSLCGNLKPEHAPYTSMTVSTCTV